MKQLIFCLCMFSALMPAIFSLAAEPSSPGLPNPFYAMDTAFRRPELKLEQQLDLVKELGFAGIAWTEAAPEQVTATLQQVETRGLKMFTIYCAGNITPEGKLSYSANLPKIMAALKDHGTIIWLHIGGKGPDFATLNSDSPVVTKLRDLADQAAANQLTVAVYPHVGEWTARFADATRLAKIVNHKAFGVTFNLCHALAMGEESRIPTLIEQSKGVLFTASISGADSGVGSANWDRLIQTLDKGTYDTGLILRKFKGIGFTGPIGFQGYGIKGDARSILTPTMAAWRKLSAAAQR